MSESHKKFNAAQLRLLIVIEILSGNEVKGIGLRETTNAANAMGHKTTDSTVLHDLEALESTGWAERMSDDKNKWRLCAKPYQLFMNLNWGLQKARRQIAEVDQNFTRLANRNKEKNNDRRKKAD